MFRVRRVGLKTDICLWNKTTSDCTSMVNRLFLWLESDCARNRHHPPRPSPDPTLPLRAPPAELLRAFQRRRRRTDNPVQGRLYSHAHVLSGTPPPRPRPPTVRMELPAPALRCAARL